MEIILTRDVTNLGMAGQVLKVSPGYARNYLLPGDHALPATPHNLKILAKKRQEFEDRSRAVKDEAVELKKRLDSLILTITRKSLDKGKLYGAVTAQDLVEAANLEGIVLDRRRLKIVEPIKAIGDYEIGVRLHSDVQGSFRVKVIPEAVVEPPAPPAEPAKEGKDAKRSRRNRGEGRTRDEAPRDEAPLKADPEVAPDAKPETVNEATPLVASSPEENA